MLKKDVLDLINLLFALNNDKNLELSDLEVYKYQKMRELVTNTVPDNSIEVRFETNHVDWKYC